MVRRLSLVEVGIGSEGLADLRVDRGQRKRAQPWLLDILNIAHAAAEDLADLRAYDRAIAEDGESIPHE